MTSQQSGMSIAVELWIMGKWCRFAIHLLDWTIAFQQGPEGSANIRLGPFQMCWN